MLARLLALVAALVLAFATPPAATAATRRPLTVLISIDAFRADYLDRGATPTLYAMAEHGVRAAMRPSFPSKTFPNHYTLVTGLRPDEHGVVANNMWDEAMPGVTFRMSNDAAVKDGRWWSEAEPIWVTAEKAGIVTGTMFWPGSEAAIGGVRPHYTEHFDAQMSSNDRVDHLLAWLDKPQRPRFATLYFDIVDTAGHDYGPDSPQVSTAAATVDAAIARLQAGLRARRIAANVVVVADHGMAPTRIDRTIYLDDLLPKDAYKALDLGPIGTIYPTAGREAQVEAALLPAHPHLQCWRKGDIPARFHYGRNPRVAPIFCLPETGWVLTTRDFKPKHVDGGEHGYDNQSPEMLAIFVASGPAFRHGVRLPVFDNVDVYPLLARLVGVKPRPNDGRLGDLAAGLRAR